MKEKLARVTAKSMQIGALLDSTLALVVELVKKQRAKDTAIKFVVIDSCATLRPSISCLIQNFRVGLNKSVGDAFRLAVDIQCHAGTTILCITFHFLEVAAPERGTACTKREDAVNLGGGSEVIELYIVFSD